MRVGGVAIQGWEALRAARGGSDPCKGPVCAGIQYKPTLLEQGQKTIQSLHQSVVAAAFRKNTNTEAQVGKSDAGNVKRFRSLQVQPYSAGGIGLSLDRLRDDNGVEKDHSKGTGSAGILCCGHSMAARSSADNPVRGPSSADAMSKPSLSGGQTVVS